MSKKFPWMRDCKGFQTVRFSTCKTIEKYILYKTGLKQVQVHKTEKYLVVNYSTAIGQNIRKIPLPAGCLYCLTEECFNDLFQEISDKKPNPNEKLKQIVIFMRELGIDVNDPYDFTNWMDEIASHSELFRTGLFE